MADSEDTKQPRRNLDDRLKALRERSEQAAERAEGAAAETPRQLFLPGMDELMRAMPNHIARSSLFAPVAPGRKKMHDGTVLVSRSDAVIRFKGKQLDESQADVWLQAMYEATKQPLGEPVIINRAEFLRSIGKNTSGENYKWLHRAMEDLAFAMLVIEVTKDGKRKLSMGSTRALHMIAGFDYDEETEAYTLRIDPRWRTLHGNREFALIDWDKRLQIGQGQNMAKAMQRLLATSSDRVQHYALDWLKDKLEYTGRMRDFIGALGAAMQELVRLEIATSWKVGKSTKGKEQLTVYLPEQPE